MIDNKKEKEFIRFGTKLSMLYIFLGVIGFFIIILPMVFYSNKKLDNIGIIGDTVGGLLNPILAVPATLLTFLAFWVQYKSNIETKEQFEKQNEDQLFFRLIDNLQNRIINYRTGSDNSFDISAKSESYNSLVIILNELKNLMELKLSDFGRYLLAKNPEIIDDYHFDKISDLDIGFLKKIEIKNELIKINNYNDRWEFLKSIFNSSGNENRGQNEILKSIGTVYFYKTNIKNRKRYYEDVFSTINIKYEVFLDGYLKNLEYIFNFISKANYNKEFYSDFLENNLTSYEKGIIFYYLASNKVNNSFKSHVKKIKLLDNLHTNNYFFVDIPSFEEYQKELNDLINYNESN